MSTIGERIYDIRKDSRLSQTEFGKLIGVSQTHISKIEKNQEKPSLTLVKLISKLFAVSEAWLYSGDGLMKGKNYMDKPMRKINVEEFKRLAPGDSICCRFWKRTLSTKVAAPAFYNADADTPGWEILTDSGYIAMESVYVEAHNISKVLTVSSSHLCEDTMSQMNEYISHKEDMCDSVFGKLSMYKMTDGVILIAVPEEITKSTDSALIEEAYEDLYAPIKLAANNGCRWLCVDDSAELDSDLPVYER